MTRLSRMIAGLRRKPQQPNRAGDQDWRVGDLAELVTAGRWVELDGTPVSGPIVGDLQVVATVIERPCRCSAEREQFLNFARWPGDMFEARAFRKIVPRADQLVAGDSAWLDQLIGRPAAPPLTARRETV